LEVVMTSPGQPVQRSQDDPEVTEGADEPLAGAQHPTTESSPRSPRSGWLRVTLAVIAFVGLSAVLIGVLISTGTHQTTLSGPSAGPAPRTTAGGGIAATNAPTGTTKAKGNVISAAKVAEGAGAISLPTRMKRPALNWQAGAGGEDLAAVSHWFGDALQAGGIRQYSAMRYACAELGASVATAEAGPKIPDLAMQTLYARALAELARGAANCRMAIILKPSGDETLDTRVNTTLLKLSVSELATGAKDIFRATAEIEIVSREHP
jgi:hypothetical protein